MVECGSFREPPNFQNLTIWGIITLVIMLILGIDSICGAIWSLGFHDSLYSLLVLIGSCFGIAGLVLVVLSLIQKNPQYMTYGIFCFLISCIIHTVYFIICLIRGHHLNASSVLNLILDILLCALFYFQNKGFTPS